MMPHLAHGYERHLGGSVGTGQCVALVRETAGLPSTAHWRRGDPVSPGDAVGTCIATFTAAGRYANSMSGDSHAAILQQVHDDGSMTVIDQWLNQRVHERVIRNRHGAGKAINDSSRFFVIELQDDGDG